MIYARLESALRYRGIHPNLDLALSHLTPDFLACLSEDPTELQGKDVYATRFVYPTVPEEGVLFEAHIQYLDIHIMLSGRERVEIASPASLALVESHPERDLYFYRGKGCPLVLEPGNFLVVFPDDAHKLKLQTDLEETVTKAVFKVRIS